jgi:hypothetical protein
MTTELETLDRKVRAVLHPKRPRLPEARAAVAGVTSPEDAWRALAVWGLVPGAPARDDGAYRTGGSQRPAGVVDGAALREGATTVDGCVALASDPSGLVQASADGLAWASRLEPWGVEPPRGVRWRTGVRHGFLLELSRVAAWTSLSRALDATLRAEVPSRPPGVDPRSPGVRAFLADLEASGRWTRTRQEGLRVPEGHRPAGALYAALPDPFEALLSLWGVGYGLVGYADGFVLLFAPMA